MTNIRQLVNLNPHVTDNDALMMKALKEGERKEIFTQEMLGIVSKYNTVMNITHTVYSSNPNLLYYYVEQSQAWYLRVGTNYVVIKLTEAPVSDSIDEGVPDESSVEGMEVVLRKNNTVIVVDIHKKYRELLENNHLTPNTSIGTNMKERIEELDARKDELLSLGRGSTVPYCYIRE